MSDETDRMEDAPFRFGDVISVTYQAAEIPTPTIGEVREYGTYPAPWLRVVGRTVQRGPWTGPEHDTVVFLGPGVLVALVGSTVPR